MKVYDLIRMFKFYNFNIVFKMTIQIPHLNTFENIEVSTKEYYINGICNNIEDSLKYAPIEKYEISENLIKATIKM